MARFFLNNVRMSFPVLFVPEPFPDSDDKTEYFSGAFILTPDHPQLPELNKLIDTLCEAKFGTNWKKVKEAATRLGKICLKDGDLKPDTQGYPGNWVINARDPVRPTVIGPQRQPLVQSDGKPYSGCYVNAILDLFAYSNAAKGVGARLKGVQFVRDGDAFSGGPPASAEDFDDLSNTGEAEGAEVDPLAS